MKIRYIYKVLQNMEATYFVFVTLMLARRVLVKFRLFSSCIVL